MADERIEIQADIDVAPSIAKIRELKKELRTITDPEEFKRVQQQIDDMTESVKAGQVGAGNFAEVLGTLPGPIGDIAGRAGGLIGSLKQFGQIKLTDIKGSFVELGKDLIDAAKGIGNLTGITKIYTVVNNALATSFRAIGIAEGTAAAGATAFAAALTATGVGALVVAIGVAISGLIELTKQLYSVVSGEAEMEAAIKKANIELERQTTLFDLDSKSAERRNKIRLAELRASGASENEIRAQNQKFAQEQLELALNNQLEANKQYNANFNKLTVEEFKKFIDNKDKADERVKDAETNLKETRLNNQAAVLAEEKSAAAKSAGIAEQAAAKRKALIEKEIAEIKTAQKEAFLSTLSEKEKEEYLVNEKYTALIYQAQKYGEDSTLIRQQQQKELDAITTKFNAVEYEKSAKALELKNAQGLLKEEEYQKSLYDLAVQYGTQVEEATIKYEAFKTEQKKKGAEEARQIIFMELQDQLDALDRANDEIQGDFEQDQIRLEAKKTLLQQQKELELTAAEGDAVKRLEIIKKYADAERQIDKDLTDSKLAEYEARRTAQNQFLNGVGAAFGQLAGLFEQGSAASKAFALAEIAIGTGVGFINALDIAQKSAKATGPAAAFAFPIFYATQIAAVLAAASRARAILNTPKASAGGGSAGSVPNIPAPTFNAPRGIAAPQIQTGVGTTPGQEIAATLSRATQRPIVAQVVSTAVSSQQALDRRTNGAATFGG